MWFSWFWTKNRSTFVGPEEQEKWNAGQAEARKDLIAAKSALDAAARANEATKLSTDLIRKAGRIRHELVSGNDVSRWQAAAKQFTKKKIPRKSLKS